MWKEVATNGWRLSSFGFLSSENFWDFPEVLTWICFLLASSPAPSLPGALTAAGDPPPVNKDPCTEASSPAWEMASAWPSLPPAPGPPFPGLTLPFHGLSFHISFSEMPSLTSVSEKTLSFYKSTSCDSWQQSRRLGATAMNPACLVGVLAPLFSNCVTLDPSHILSGPQFSYL